MKLTISTFSDLGDLIGTTGMNNHVSRKRQSEQTNIVPVDAFEADLDELEAELPRRSYMYWGNPEQIWADEGL